MTLPLTGPISIGMVAAELGISLPLSLGDPRVRALAGVPSGPISLGQLRGKSAYTPMTVTPTAGAGSFDSSVNGGTATCQPSVAVVGGTGGYTYLWAFTSNPDGCSLSNTTLAACVVGKAYAKNASGSTHPVLQCTVTDNTGHTVTASGIPADMDWSP